MCDNKCEEKLDKLSVKLDKMYENLTKDFVGVHDDITEFKAYIGNQLNTIKLSIETNTTGISNQAVKLRDFENIQIQNGQKIKSLEDEISGLKLTSSVEPDLQSLQSEVQSLKNALDDQVNRNCRQTLVFWGVPEAPDEGNDKTTTILADVLAKASNTVTENVRIHLDRVHRGRKSNNDGKPRPIFAKFTTWRDAQDYKQHIIESNRKKKDAPPSIFVDQLYSSEVSRRRKLARDERKKPKENDSSLKCYIKYPAKLMIKIDSKYVLHKEF